MALDDGSRSEDAARLAQLRAEAAALQRTPLRARSGANVTQMHYAKKGIVTPEMEYVALRENGRRRIVVQANSDGRTDMGQIIAGIRRVLDETHLPEGVSPRLEGTYEAQGEAARTIGGLSLVSLALVFALLHGRYRSVPLALIVMGNVPLALIGSVLALWIAGLPLSVASMIGFVTLTGSLMANNESSHAFTCGIPHRNTQTLSTSHGNHALSTWFDAWFVAGDSLAPLSSGSPPRFVERHTLAGCHTRRNNVSAPMEQTAATISTSHGP